jgi:integration host factor subunit beta
MGHTQTSIADTVSKELELPLRVGRHFLQRVLDIICDDIVYTGEVRFRGLGSFSVKTRPPVDTTHPGTGEPIHIPKKKILHFRTSESLRKRLNPKRALRKRKPRKS